MEASQCKSRAFISVVTATCCIYRLLTNRHAPISRLVSHLPLHNTCGMPWTKLYFLLLDKEPEVYSTAHLIDGIPTATYFPDLHVIHRVCIPQRNHLARPTRGSSSLFSPWIHRTPTSPISYQALRDVRMTSICCSRTGFILRRTEHMGLPPSRTGGGCLRLCARASKPHVASSLACR